MPSEADKQLQADVAQKKELRRELKERRAALAPEERAAIDARIAEHVLALPAWKDASVVCAYASFGDEVDTWSLIEQAWAAGKQVLLPRVLPGTRQLQWFPVRSKGELAPSGWGILEPDDAAAEEVDIKAVSREQSSVALVPALAFDARGFRLGYGGGFYDRFLSDFGGTSIGLVRSMFFFEGLACLEAHDQAVDIVVSEHGALVGQA